MPACSLVRGTSTRQPKSGLVSNQDSFSRRSTTAPTTVTAGCASRAALASAAMSASVETMVSCVVVVPAWVIATGVSADRPAATSASAISAMCGSAESSTSVSWSAYDAQSTFGADAATTANSRWSLLVTGMPAYAGTAVAAETPGTISKPTPALTTACASSGPEA